MTTRDSILLAAQEAFELGGEDGLSLRDVAARAQITPMAIYRHFENKQALLDAVVEAATRDWRRRVAEIAPGTPREWMTRIGDTYLDFALHTPRKFEAAFLVASAKALRYPDDFVTGGSPAVTLQMELLGELGSRGRKASKSTGIERMIMLASLAQGLITLYRAGRIAGDETAFRALYRRAMTRCIDSFDREPSE